MNSQVFIIIPNDIFCWGFFQVQQRCLLARTEIFNMFTVRTEQCKGEKLVCWRGLTCSHTHSTTCFGLYAVISSLNGCLILTRYFMVLTLTSNGSRRTLAYMWSICLTRTRPAVLLTWPGTHWTTSCHTTAAWTQISATSLLTGGFGR